MPGADPITETPVRTPRQLGAFIRRVRRQRGLTQAALGRITGLRQETVSLVEAGNPAAKLETILAVLAALDLEFRVAHRSKGADISEIF